MYTRLSELADNSADAEKASGVEWRGPRSPATEGGTSTHRGHLIVRAVRTEEGVVEFALDAVECPVEMIVPSTCFCDKLDERSGRANVQGFAVIVSRLNMCVE